MVRATVAVTVSYIIMFVLAFIAFAGAYLIVGPDVAFKTGIYEASTNWIAIAFVIQLVIAIWVPFAFPFASAIGILTGAKLKRRN